jgi:hypothetical protein
LASGRDARRRFAYPLAEAKLGCGAVTTQGDVDMKLAGWTCAAATAALGIYAAPAYAEAPRSVFCMATRTTPKLDQNNYVAGASGQVYATRNFTTGLPEEVLVPMWRAFIVAKHPARPGAMPTTPAIPPTPGAPR